MKIAIIGAGAGGLTAAHEFNKLGHDVTIFEKNNAAGGLAGGFQEVNWDWSVEYFYHHWFQSDNAILSLIKELGLYEKVRFILPKTVLFHDGHFYPLDSIKAVLTFPGFNFLDKMRFGLVTAYLRYIARWQPLEKVTAHQWMNKVYGKKIYQINFEPLLKGKFGDYYKEIPMSWFWARFKARTSKLGTYEGGFQTFFDDFLAILKDRNVIIHLNTNIQKIKSAADGKIRVFWNSSSQIFDKLIITSSPSSLNKLSDELPVEYVNSLRSLHSIGAIILLLSIKKPLSPEGYYWYSLPKTEDFPFLALVEHTNFISSQNFDKENLIYCGDYLPPNHRYFSMSKEELIIEFQDTLKRINPQFDTSWINHAWLFKQSYAQPVPFVNHSKTIPPIVTPLKNVYLATMSQVYPWDRGTNYAVKLIQNAIGSILKN